ncbi:unnamed protein product, partial [marine sediment metagenome]
TPPPVPPVANPGSIGQLAEVAVGAYTEIRDIIAVSEAAAGDLVTVEVKVKNLHTGYNYISVTGQFDDTALSFSPEYEYVIPWGECSFTGFFNMPNKDVRVHIWSWYWDGSQWQIVGVGDDYSYADIALAVPPEVYAGTISRKELEYDSKRSAIPVY